MVPLEEKPVVSVIIVSFNTADITLNCLRAVFQQDLSVPFEVIVVDNGSVDNSVERIRNEFPDVQVIALSENIGFGPANNLGLQQSRGRYVLFLNSDTVVEPSSLRTCLEYLEQHHRVGMVGCKLVLPDGRLDHGCRRGLPTPGRALLYFSRLGALFPRSRWLNGYTLSFMDPDQVASVDCISGAFMFVRREVLEQVGGFDPDYFFYGEDIDLCFRVRQAGWEIHYLPTARTLHLRGASTGTSNWKVRSLFFETMWIFYQKHLRRRYNPLVTTAVRMATWVGVAYARVMERLANGFPRLRIKS